MRNRHLNWYVVSITILTAVFCGTCNSPAPNVISKYATRFINKQPDEELKEISQMFLREWNTSNFIEKGKTIAFSRVEDGQKLYESANFAARTICEELKGTLQIFPEQNEKYACQLSCRIEASDLPSKVEGDYIHLVKEMFFKFTLIDSRDGSFVWKCQVSLIRERLVPRDNR